MRTLLVFVVVAAIASPALADDNVVGTFEVKFDEMASGCTPPPVALARQKLKIEIKKNSLVVNTDVIPEMVGVPAKGGKINAKTKLVGTTVVGLSATYSVAGHVEDGVVSLVLVADYVNQATKKPYCTQSWNVSGLRENIAEKPTK